MTSALTPAGVHEAGHVVVAYALGRRVSLVRLGSHPVPDDHPHAEVLAGSIAGGETRFGPDLASEISKRFNDGQPLALEHVEWLRAELVICHAGTAAEERLLGSATPEGWTADAQQGAVVVRMLGITDDSDGGAARVERAANIATSLVDALESELERVAARFSQGTVELDEAAITLLLEESGLRRGSHRELLEELADR
jgi:hypothetical protein